MIREYIKSDQTNILELGLTFTPNFKNLMNLEHLNDHPFSKIYVYEENNIIFGFINFFQSYEEADLNFVVVTEKKRQSGIGSKLLEYMITKLASEGVKKIFLEVRVSNNKAIGLYQKYGFKEIGQRKNYYENEDALVMELKL